MSIYCSTSCPELGFISVLDFCHSTRYVLVSLCCFKFHIPDCIIYGAYFHTLLFHLNIFFGEMAFNIFSYISFFNWVILLLWNFKFLVSFRWNSFIRFIFCKYFLSVWGLAFHSLEFGNIFIIFFFLHEYTEMSHLNESFKCLCQNT